MLGNILIILIFVWVISGIINNVCKIIEFGLDRKLKELKEQNTIMLHHEIVLKAEIEKEIANSRNLKE